MGFMKVSKLLLWLCILCSMAKAQRRKEDSSEEPKRKRGDRTKNGVSDDKKTTTTHVPPTPVATTTKNDTTTPLPSRTNGLATTAKPPATAVPPPTTTAVPLSKSNGKRKWTRTESKPRRYDWGGNVEADREANMASEEVRHDFTEAIAEHDPMEELSDLKQLQLYNEWKAEAQAIVEQNPNARFKFRKSGHPVVNFYNTFANKNACHPQETDAFIERLGRAMEGILSASELWSDSEWNGRDRRELFNCKCKGSGGYCGSWCGRRRRLLSETEELTLRENTPEEMEALINGIVQRLKVECEASLRNIATYSSNLESTCRDALKAIQCEVLLNVWDHVSLEVDGSEIFAQSMIDAELSA